MSDIIPFDNLDQSLPIDATPELIYVDEIFEKTVKENDPEVMFGYMINIQQQFQIRGLALCKALYLMNGHWNSFDVGDVFIDTAQHYLGLTRHTIERYIRVWSLFLNAPSNVVSDLQQKNLKTLFPVANAIAQGYEIMDSTWDKIAEAPDYVSVSRIINEEVKDGEGTRSNRLTIIMDRRGGLWANTPNDRKFIGSFEIDDEDETVQKAIERLIKNSGVVKQ